MKSVNTFTLNERTLKSEKDKIIFVTGRYRNHLVETPILHKKKPRLRKLKSFPRSQRFLATDREASETHVSPGTQASTPTCRGEQHECDLSCGEARLTLFL